MSSVERFSTTTLKCFIPKSCRMPDFKLKKSLFCIAVIFCLASMAHAAVLEVPLYKLTPAKTIDLKCISAEYTIPLSVPERWEIEKTVMRFKYVNSSSLLENKSTLVVKANGYPIAQIKLSPVVPEGEVKVAIPAILLDPGYNNISFAVSQHYTDECEDPCAPDLWTTIKVDESFLRVEYSLKPVPLQLSAIPEYIFDPKIFPHGKVNFIVDGLTSEELVNYAGIVASGIALRFDYRQVFFTLSKDIKPNVDNILLGKKEFTDDFLRKNGIELNENSGPLLKITHLPLEKTVRDPYHALITISGEDIDQVKLAAETFAIMSFPFPDSDEMKPVKFELPDVSQYSGRLMLVPDKKYTFKTLNLETYTFKGITPNPAEITFRLPPDFLVKQNQYANISLHFAYGAGMRNFSVVNVLLNGKHIRAVRLDSEYGNIVEGYNVSIPTHLFRAGTNVITFAPVLTPTMGSNCEPIPIDNLFFTLFDNSTFIFPPMPHLVELPKLELFFLNGFPFTRWPDGHESLIFIAQPTSSAIASAFNIMGSITQKNGFPLLEMKIGFRKPDEWDGEIIILGSIESIPDDLKELAPLKLTKKTSVPYPVVKSWREKKPLLSAGK
ncbi:MAG: cellulose biosynthesis cyclic di-GMP-binding regulatory protein BcsB [Planctomycetes bacterium]|nr:cellulose biosynthesis cyclic di-GMP-binding regulatory protein BcsB [Planctomycetota bacterium]